MSLEEVLESHKVIKVIEHEDKASGVIELTSGGNKMKGLNEGWYDRPSVVAAKNRPKKKDKLIEKKTN
jgi:hypothetical protein